MNNDYNNQQNFQQPIQPQEGYAQPVQRPTPSNYQQSAQPYVQPYQQYGQAYQQPVYSYPTQASVEGKGQAIASVICGSCALFFGLILGFIGITALLGLAGGVVGIVMFVISGKKGFKGGLRTTGLVLSIIGLVFSVIFIAVWALALVAAGAIFSVLF